MDTKIQITDIDIGLNVLRVDKMTTRNSVRIALFDEDNNIAVLFSGMYGYHKLPGGGMEVGESEEVSLKRETSEETGCKIKDIEKIVTIEEIRTHEVVHQLSFCYKAIVDGEKNIQNLQGYEATEGLEIKWLSYIEILQILEKEYPAQPYAGKFMNLRDRIFLEKLI